MKDKLNTDRRVYEHEQTAMADGLKAREYLEKPITKIPESPKEEEFEKLLPWNINPNLIPFESVRTDETDYYEKRFDGNASNPCLISMAEASGFEPEHRHTPI